MSSIRVPERKSDFGACALCWLFAAPGRTRARGSAKVKAARGRLGKFHELREHSANLGQEVSAFRAGPACERGCPLQSGFVRAVFWGKAARQVMAMDGVSGGGIREDLLHATEEMYREAAEELVAALNRLRSGHTEDAKATAQAMRELKIAFQLIMDERTRVDKLRKQVAGIVHDHAFDFDAARDEIGRRLACLRDAGSGG